MKKILLLILLLPLGVKSQSLDRIGVGVITIIYPQGAIKFYEDTVVKTVKKEVIFSMKEKEFEKLLDTKWVAPVQSLVIDEFKNVKYLDLICLEHRNKWFRVKPNQNSDNSYWLLEGDSFSFNEWNEHLKGMLCVMRKDTTNKIHKANNLKSEVIRFEKYECFRPLEIKGEWMKIGFYEKATEEVIEGDIIELGWIQWRSKNSLLINYYQY